MDIREKLYRQLKESENLKWIAKHVGKHLEQDMIQEVALTICEKPICYLEAINSFENWAARIMFNFATKTGKSRHYTERELDGFKIMQVHYSEYDEDIDEMAKQAEKEIEKLSKGKCWYDGKLFQAYLEEGSMRKLSRETDIPLTSIYVSINDTREVLKEKLKND